ncbi:Cobalamine-related hypothetical metal-binding protein CrdX [Clostridiaceae bacterium JG1575]|nr:Cobalamine-related hypothetical metal-binding protein CrdX [Clostridiaceae bacterium JG1575]
MKNSYKYFENRECAYYPCHEQADPDAFNCLFCYCPLYLLGPKCGGNFKYVGPDQSIKDCSACLFPHRPENYEAILERFRREGRKKAQQDASSAKASEDSKDR